jgi:hypothetical protein
MIANASSRVAKVGASYFGAALVVAVERVGEGLEDRIAARGGAGKPR